MRQDNFYQSDIPVEAEKRFISPYRREERCTESGCGASIWLEECEYWLNGELVGKRSFEEDGSLAIERPFRHGKFHGRYYRWHIDAGLEYAAMYLNGKRHGNTYQWDEDGTLIGSSTFEHGTGYDLWWDRYWQANKPGFFLAEVMAYKDGRQHGFQWWLNEDQQSVWKEMHYWEGNWHGIWRMWDHDGILDPGYPKYFVCNNEVDRKTYVAASLKDPTLPAWREADQLAGRTFPEDLRQFLTRIDAENRKF